MGAPGGRVKPARKSVLDQRSTIHQLDQSVTQMLENTDFAVFPSFDFGQQTVLCHHRAHTLYHYHRRAALSLPASSGTCSTMAPAALSEEIEPRNALDSERRKQDSNRFQNPNSKIIFSTKVFTDCEMMHFKNHKFCFSFLQGHVSSLILEFCDFQNF